MASDLNDHDSSTERFATRKLAVLADAERERHTLMAQEARYHLGNLRTEATRHEDALAHIENVFRLRTGQPENEETP
jgi:hypothetical protein